jgi:hypothetical protein
MIEYSEIGLIVDRPGEFTDEGTEIKPATYLDGWFVNFTPANFPEELAKFQIFPSNPVRVFSGAPTVFLRFEDEAQWAGIRDGLLQD